MFFYSQNGLTILLSRSCAFRRLCRVMVISLNQVGVPHPKNVEEYKSLLCQQRVDSVDRYFSLFRTSPGLINDSQRIAYFVLHKTNRGLGVKRIPFTGLILSNF